MKDVLEKFNEQLLDSMTKYSAKADNLEYAAKFIWVMSTSDPDESEMVYDIIDKVSMTDGKLRDELAVELSRLITQIRFKIVKLLIEEAEKLRGLSGLYSDASAILLQFVK